MKNQVTEKSSLSILLVLVQFSCLLYLGFSGPVYDIRHYAFLLEIASILFAFWAILVMRSSRLNVFPDIKEGSVLVHNGPYRIIRHPMYLAVILFTLSLLLMHYTPLRLAVFLVLVVDLILKIEYEESLLHISFTGYSEYRKRTFKLIPLVY